MKRTRSWPRGRALLACAVLGFAPVVAADFEVNAPDGRRILLKDDKTWQYVDDKSAGKPKESLIEPDKPRITGEAVLSIERRVQVAGGCLFSLHLVNNFPHVIQSLFPMFSAERANGVVYDTVSAGFQGLKPGDRQNREIMFRGIACQDIARVHVTGGDRCVMGDLDRFSFDEGVCLSRVRIVGSDFVRFDK